MRCSHRTRRAMTGRPPCLRTRLSGGMVTAALLCFELLSLMGRLPDVKTWRFSSVSQLSGGISDALHRLLPHPQNGGLRLRGISPQVFSAKRRRRRPHGAAAPQSGASVVGARPRLTRARLRYDSPNVPCLTQDPAGFLSINSAYCQLLLFARRKL